MTQLFDGLTHMHVTVMTHDAGLHVRFEESVFDSGSSLGYPPTSLLRFCAAGLCATTNPRKGGHQSTKLTAKTTRC